MTEQKSAPDGKPISNYDENGLHIHTIIPENSGLADMSSGAKCRFTRPVDVQYDDEIHKTYVVSRSGDLKTLKTYSKFKTTWLDWRKIAQSIVE